MMNRLLIPAFLAAGLNAGLLAQNSAQGYAYYSVDGYGDLAIGNARSVGAGGEGFLYRGLAVGADAGYVAPTGDHGDGGLGLATVGASYHFNNRLRTRHFVPFGGGGYGVAFRGDTLNTLYYGFGATYWFHDRFGARFEVRDYHSTDGRFMSSFRFALSFR